MPATAQSIRPQGHSHSISTRTTKIRHFMTRVLFSLAQSEIQLLLNAFGHAAFGIINVAIRI